MDQTMVQQLIQQALAVQEQRFRQTVDTLNAEIADLKNLIIDNFVNRPPPTPKPKLPDVAKFDGTSAMWEVWQPEMKAKLRIDGKALGDEKDGGKFWYLYGRLKTKVQQLVAPQLAQAEELQSYDHHTLLDQLSRLCDDPNAKRNAEEKLQSLKMFNDETVNAFLARFERQLYKAHANKWSDAAKVSLIRRQLNSQTKALLRTQVNEPADYDSFVKLLQRLDNKHHTAPASSQASGHSQRLSSQAPRHSQQSGTDSNAMDISAVQVASMGIATTDDEGTASSDDEEESNIRLIYNRETGKYKRVQMA